jgi:tellurite resistance protein TerC
VGIQSVGTPALWIGFTLFVLVMLALDLGVFHRKSKEQTVKGALGWTVFWIVLSLCFNGLVYYWFGQTKALEFLTGYVIEKALSVDNLFVFLVIFSYFAVSKALQHRVLFWGILGALIMRALFIVPGAALIQHFHWVIYIFGGFLVLTGIRLMFQNEEDVHPERNPALRLFRRFVPISNDFDGSRFFTRQAGRLMATPLLMVLVVVEASDVLFAVDSIPAIFAITADPFIVYTSNIFAILGLRALFFALSGMMGKFHYLNVGLALVLTFVGVKMLISSWYKIPIGLSLGVVALLLTGAIVISILRPPPPEPEPPIVADDDDPAPAA